MERFGTEEKEGTLPSLRLKILRKAAVSDRATAGVGVNGCHPKIILDFSDDCCERILTLLHKVEVAER